MNDSKVAPMETIADTWTVIAKANVGTVSLGEFLPIIINLSTLLQVVHMRNSLGRKLFGEPKFRPSLESMPSIVVIMYSLKKDRTILNLMLCPFRFGPSI
jgi:hypothetical protein